MQGYLAQTQQKLAETDKSPKAHWKDSIHPLRNSEVLRREAQLERRVVGGSKNPFPTYRQAILDKKKRGLARLLDLKDDLKSASTDRRKQIEKVKNIKEFARSA